MGHICPTDGVGLAQNIPTSQCCSSLGIFGTALAELLRGRSSEVVLARIEGAGQAYVRFELLGYLARRPDACDTIEGIIHWWLYDQRQSIGRETITAMVGRLVAQGALQERRGPGGEILYAAAPDPIPSPQRQE